MLHVCDIDGGGSWFAIFFLITTDILGPANAPFALSQVGFVPGVVLYIVSEYSDNETHAITPELITMITSLDVIQWASLRAIPD